MARQLVAGHGTIVCLALPSVNLEEGPDAIADISPAVCFDLAIGTVFDTSVHLGAVGRAEHAGDRHVEATLAFLPLLSVAVRSSLIGGGTHRRCCSDNLSK